MRTIEELKRAVIVEVDRLEPRLWAAAEAIGRDPEIGHQETRAVGRLGDLLREGGVAVEVGVYGLATAFEARIGSRRRPTVAILAEYDALPNVGHGCGHNLIGTSAVGAGLALAAITEDLPGSAVVFGTPAEESTVENSGGKAHMVRAGAFDDVDATIMFHPSQYTTVSLEGSLAARGVDFRFHGTAAHAALAPWEGVNALDGVIHTFNGVNALREHFRPDIRAHGVITDGGGVPNVVPAFAACRFRVRAPDAETLEGVFAKIVRCAEGGALMAGARLEVHEYMPAYENVVPSHALARAFRDNLAALGLEVLPSRPEPGLGSTDFGNVSRRVPSIEAAIAIADPGVPHHSAAFAEAALSEKAHGASIAAAKGLAMTAIDILTDRALLAAAQEEFAAGPGRRGESDAPA
ncbi:MAG: M20 family metallopeptidase [Chloroflexi bacterium]|nr:M20 family metallopeptidase [Chloroflexota bacterium]